MSAIIQVEKLGKSYQINHTHAARYSTLRDTLVQRGRALLPGSGKVHVASPASSSKKELFWALKDVSFEVKQGEVMGIIGRNGAGKSTLLKILARVTQPSEGRITLRGRVASLLEVGTGFHPELTGRENIYLNGAILGMTRAEIRGKFDEIAAFAEVERFLDTPVKHYSSGMYVRLAFAVAAHLEPEILIVDEVLAVGDAQFLKKSSGRISAAAREGRTILFVSHQLPTLQQLCTSGILLDQGQVKCRGSMDEVIARYLEQGAGLSGAWHLNGSSKPERRAQITAIALHQPSGNTAASFHSDESLRFTVAIHCAQDISQVQLAVRITNAAGVPVFTTADCDGLEHLRSFPTGDHRLAFEIPAALLAPDRYSTIFCLCKPGVEEIHTVRDAVSFEIVDSLTHASRFHDRRAGVVTPLIHWEHQQV